MPQSSAPRIRVQPTAKPGEIIEIKTLIAHDMESGQRKDAAGTLIPRKILKEFAATFNGQPLFRAEWQSAISANPFQGFFMKATQSGTLDFAWSDDDGSVIRASAQLTVAE